MRDYQKMYEAVKAVVERYEEDIDGQDKQYPFMDEYEQATHQARQNLIDDIADEIERIEQSNKPKGDD